MKISKKLLRKIIREEYSRIIFDQGQLIKEARHLFVEGHGDLSQYSLEELEAAYSATSCPQAKASIEEELSTRPAAAENQQPTEFQRMEQPESQDSDYYGY